LATKCIHITALGEGEGPTVVIAVVSNHISPMQKFSQVYIMLIVDGRSHALSVRTSAKHEICGSMVPNLSVFLSNWDSSVEDIRFYLCILT